MYGKVAVLIGSETDREIMEVARQYFDYFEIEMDLRVMSAHRSPGEVSKFAISARSNGYHILIGAAGMAAHLAGALKAYSQFPPGAEETSDLRVDPPQRTEDLFGTPDIPGIIP